MMQSFRGLFYSVLREYPFRTGPGEKEVVELELMTVESEIDQPCFNNAQRADSMLPSLESFYDLIAYLDAIAQGGPTKKTLMPRRTN